MFGTSMAEIAHHVMLIYMAKVEIEALYKCSLKMHTYCGYLEDIMFTIAPHHGCFLCISCYI